MKFKVCFGSIKEILFYNNYEIMANSFNLSVHSIYFYLTVVLLFFNIVDTFKQTSEIEPEVVYHLGTKTPYRIVANTNDSFVKYPGKAYFLLFC